ncbi:hypothetical protein B0J14DRAFT_19700 [Halenospora varia]|nr:hypothetical protein B0J14DRAFT_19700 [Halenospora varia]
MTLSRSRTITLAVAIATLASNTLSSILFLHLPDDPLHLASNFGWYLHFANILSVFGCIGAMRKHALSIAIFANYLLLDTILFAIPRFLILTLINTLTTTICSPSSSLSPSLYQSFSSSTSSSTYLSSTLPNLDSSPIEPNFFSQYTRSWTPEGCERIVWLAQLTMAAGVVAATLLQFVGALSVREYGRNCIYDEGDEVQGRRKGKKVWRGCIHACI